MYSSLDTASKSTTSSGRSRSRPKIEMRATRIRPGTHLTGSGSSLPAANSRRQPINALWVRTQVTGFWRARTDPSAGGYGVMRFDGEKWQNFRIGDGLVHNRVYSIAAGKDGSVWFGTFGGVSRFDGENWTSYTRNNGMSGNKVHRIIVAQDGKVWCAHGEAGGISFFDGQNWMRYSKSNGMLASLVRSVSQSDDGSLWFGTSRDEPGASGIVRYRDGAWLRILSEDGLPGHKG